LPSDPPTKFRLLYLPNEIIREICVRPELRRKDLRALRLTSKLLCEISLQRFAKESFSEVTVLMTRLSLRTFIKLAQHPYFGSLIKLITISPVFTPHGHVIPSEVPGSECSTEMIKLVKTYLVRSRKDHELSSNGSFERMLRVAFKAIVQREQCLQLQFCDNEYNAIGTIDPLRETAFRKCLIRRLDSRAVTSQGCNVAGFSINGVNRDNSVAVSNLCANSIKQEISSLCSQLSRLEISFTHDDVESTTKSAKCMVSAACNLTHLRLLGIDSGFFSPPSYVQSILDCVASTSLESILLYGFNLSNTELIGFLDLHRDTLEEINLIAG
jgi:hypothetical protein